MVRNVKLIAREQSPNTDGIHVQRSTDVTITYSNIRTGDDCISIGQGTKYMWIERIQCGPGHGERLDLYSRAEGAWAQWGLKPPLGFGKSSFIGSLGKEMNEAGVENVTLTNSVFTGSDNGLWIKSWVRPSNGFVRNILYQNIVMKNVENPIIIDQNYCPNNQGCPRQTSGVKISQVTYKNMYIYKEHPATKVAEIFDCSPSNPCKGIIKDA